MEDCLQTWPFWLNDQTFGGQSRFLSWLWAALGKVLPTMGLSFLVCKMERLDSFSVLNEGRFALQWTFSNVWRRFWLSHKACHCLYWVEARDSAKHLTKHRAIPHNKESSGSKMSTALRLRHRTLEEWGYGDGHSRTRKQHKWWFRHRQELRHIGCDLLWGRRGNNVA